MTDVDQGTEDAEKDVMAVMNTIVPDEAATEKIKQAEKDRTEKFEGWTMGQFREAIDAVEYLTGTLKEAEKAKGKVGKALGGSGMDNPMLGMMMKSLSGGK
jgi:ATPase subunit of ABC transporter with duplicated ATPase domains